jgi:leader peptidase (prepilin peptidase)/N-methyltransferase
MLIYFTIIMGVLGAAIGSFVNVCVDRLSNGRSLISPPSHCDRCQRHLSVAELVPVLSYVWLKGRCRSCGARIPLRVLWVELGCGLFLAVLFWYKGFTLDFAVIALYSYVFTVIGLIDLHTQLILNKLVYPALVAALIIAPFFIHGAGGIVSNFINALVGGAVGFLILLVPVVVTMGRGMGVGDLKLAALIGLTTGFGEVLVAVLGGIILGGLAAIILVVFRIKKRQEAIPFGPFLSIAAVVTLLWGSTILHWYQGFFLR